MDSVPPRMICGWEKWQTHRFYNEDKGGELDTIWDPVLDFFQDED